MSNPLNSLERVTELARVQIALAERVAEAEAALEKLQREYKRVSEEDLPELMRELDLEEFVLGNGMKITVSNDYRASISAEKMPGAAKWLEKNKFDGIIKSQIAISYDRAEIEKAKKDLLKLRKTLKMPELELTASIHPQTLGAFVRERAATGVLPPEEFFSISPYAKAKITAAKGKKK